MKKEQIEEIVSKLPNYQLHVQVAIGGYSISFDPGEPHNAVEVYRYIDSKMYVTSDVKGLRYTVFSDYTMGLTEEDKINLFQENRRQANITCGLIMSGNGSVEVYERIAKCLEDIK